MIDTAALRIEHARLGRSIETNIARTGTMRYGNAILVHRLVGDLIDRIERNGGTPQERAHVLRALDARVTAR